MYFAASNKKLLPAQMFSESEYVVKMEEKASSSLFCEYHFYRRCAQHDQLDEWRREKNLNHIGVPRFIASGTQTLDDIDYRFLVLPRLYEDLHKILARNAKQLNRVQVCQVRSRFFFKLVDRI